MARKILLQLPFYVKFIFFAFVYVVKERSFTNAEEFECYTAKGGDIVKRNCLIFFCKSDDGTIIEDGVNGECSNGLCPDGGNLIYIYISKYFYIFLSVLM